MCLSKEEQIEEMSRAMCFRNTCDVKSCLAVNCETTWAALALYNAGYRKRVEGKWIKRTKYSEAECDQCGRSPKLVFGMLPEYCPHCGAYMNVEEENLKK